MKYERRSRDSFAHNADGAEFRMPSKKNCWTSSHQDSISTTSLGTITFGLYLPYRPISQGQGVGHVYPGADAAASCFT